MLKKTIKYTDYDGNERNEDFYFNLSKAEVTDWLTTSGGYTLDKVMDRLVRSENTKEIMEIFKDLIYRAYGEKSLDGRRFMKNKEIKDNFVETEAYSELYMELVGDPKKASDFIKGILPNDWSQDINSAMMNVDNMPDYAKPYIEQYAAQNNVTPIPTAVENPTN